MRVSRPRRWMVGVAHGWMRVVQSFLYALMSGWLSMRATERPARPNRVAAVHPARLAPKMATSSSAGWLILPSDGWRFSWPPSILHHLGCRGNPLATHAKDASRFPLGAIATRQDGRSPTAGGVHRRDVVPMEVRVIDDVG